MVAIMREWLNKFLSVAEKGQGLVEYALIVVLISVVSIAILTQVGSSVSTVFTTANSSLQKPAGGAAAGGS